MSRHDSFRAPFFVSMTLTLLAAAWGGCSPTPDQPPTGTTSSSGTGGTGGTGGGTGGSGGINFHSDGGDSGDEDGSCVALSAAAEHVHVDIVFLIDQSGSMSGPKWNGIRGALTDFWNDPASVGISAGIIYLPNHKTNVCVATDYETFNVPIDVLPQNAFALTNSLPADATGVGTPIYGALTGALMAASAYQDAHQAHRVILVLATDGDPNYCGTTTIDDCAYVAKSALSYNGVQTYVIGVQGSTITNLNKIAASGGTTAAYDVTSDINQFASKIAEIRKVALGCDFDLPPPPSPLALDPEKVNFTYTPKGIGMPATLPRADDLADCGGKPGWYYNSNTTPTKIILCPASCNTVEADPNAKVNVLFGCKSILN